MDRPALVGLFAACGIRARDLAVACIDGTPAPVVRWLRRGFADGHRASVLFLHDASTVVYPFSFEPLATLLACQGDRPLVYADVGLPPLGSAPRRFDRPGDVPIRHVEAIPPATLVAYCTRLAGSLAQASRRSPKRTVTLTRRFS